MIFLFEFKMGRKAVKTTWNINNAFGSGLLTNIQCSGDSKSFAKETRVLKSVVASHQKVTNQLRAIIEADPLTTTREVEKVVEEHSTALTILLSFCIWSKLERWKNSISGCLMSWLEILKKWHFEESSFLILCNSEPFLNWIVMCDKKWIIYDN